MAIRFGALRNWRRLTRLGLWAMAGAGIIFSAYLAVLYVIIIDRFEGKRWGLPSKVYSDSFILYPGQGLGGTHLLDRMRRLGYRSVPARPQKAGEYRLEPDRLEIFLREFDYPDHSSKGYLLKLSLDRGMIVRMTALPEEQDLAVAELEPELIAAYYDETWEERDLVRLDDVPQHLIDAILAVEDSRFYTHEGIDLRSILRALWVDIKAGAIVQGGSTLTQQLVKNFFLTQERRISRKINEIFMALILEMRYSKNEILEAYLNEIYLGQSGSMGIYGVGEASRFYFGKSPGGLTLGEAALLAGMIKSPNGLSPFRDPEAARDRRRVALERMRKLEMIDLDAFRRAIREELPKVQPVQRKLIAKYFVEFVRQQLADNYSARILTSEGLRIFTTLDMQQQFLAERTLGEGLRSLERRHAHLRRENADEAVQGALVVIQPQTGHIKALVGGRDYQVSQFNRIVQAKRQPGSLFKPFVYATALSQAVTPEGLPFTTSTLVEDAPFTLMSDSGLWRPENYDKTYSGHVTLRTALERSLNVATARMAQEIGIESVVETARAMGIESPLKRVPSLALGTSEVTPLEIAAAYAALPNSGMRVIPQSIKEVVDPDGRVLERRTVEVASALTPQQAYLLAYLLQGVVDRGTARGIRAMGFDRPVAGKTGTTSDYKDAWFIGFTPELLALVWVGFDRSGPSDPQEAASVQASMEGGALGLTGAQAALPIWVDYMKGATDGQPVGRFDPPPGVIFREIDPKTGLLATKACPGAVREAFIEGTEPRQTCEGPDAGPGLFRWLKQLISNPEGGL